MNDLVNEAIDAPLRRFRPYSQYEDSTIDWLGRVPSHWTIRRLRSSIEGCQNGVWGDEPDGANDIPCVRVADFDRATFRVNLSDPTLRSIPKRALQGRILRRGDLLLEKSGGGEKQPVGAVMFYDHDVEAVCSNFVARMPVSDGYSSRFLAYLHAALYSGRVNVRSIKQSTGIQNLDSKSYLRESAAFPELAEQKVIATFLDRETTKIDALIAKKERLTELLQEKRTALITRTVSKGLEPTAPMKDSGVEWLGEIPAHWNVWRLKHVSGGLTVGVVVNPSQYVSPSGVAFLRGADIGEGHISLEHVQYMSDDANAVHSKSILRAGDLVSIRVGYPGVTAVVPSELDGSNCASLLITRRSSRVDSQLLCYLMNSAIGKAQFKMLQDGAAQEQINVSDAVDFVVPLPPKSEQASIVQHVSVEAAGIDALVARVRDAIGRLKEFRTALISSVVTGKIDVRGEAA